jgi:hypothetical protein
MNYKIDTDRKLIILALEQMEVQIPYYLETLEPQLDDDEAGQRPLRRPHGSTSETR